MTPEIPLNEAISLASGDLALPCPKCRTPVSILVTPGQLRTESKRLHSDVIRTALDQFVKAKGTMELTELADGRIQLKKRPDQSVSGESETRL